VKQALRQLNLMKESQLTVAALRRRVLAPNESFRPAQIDRLLAENPPDESPRSPFPEELKAGKWRLAVEVGVAAS
jgi:hypothetical protein